MACQKRRAVRGRQKTEESLSPIREIDNRQIGLSPDDLLVVTSNNYWPSIFAGYGGAIGPNGQAQAAIHIPADNRLIGVRVHTAFATISPTAPSGIKSISNTHSFTITS